MYIPGLPTRAAYCTSTNQYRHQSQLVVGACVLKLDFLELYKLHKYLCLELVFLDFLLSKKDQLVYSSLCFVVAQIFLRLFKPIFALERRKMHLWATNFGRCFRKELNKNARQTIFNFAPMFSFYGVSKFRRP